MISSNIPYAAFTELKEEMKKARDSEAVKGMFDLITPRDLLSSAYLMFHSELKDEIKKARDLEAVKGVFDLEASYLPRILSISRHQGGTHESSAQRHRPHQGS